MTPRNRVTRSTGKGRSTMSILSKKSEPPVRQDQVDQLHWYDLEVCLAYEYGTKEDIDRAKAVRNRVWDNCTPAERQAASEKPKKVTKADKTKASRR